MADGSVSQFLSCPHCGYAEEDAGGTRQCWKGHGVYVVHTGGRSVGAGAFHSSIPDHLVTRVVAEFLELGPAVQYLTRWNEAESRLEVLLSNAE